MRPGVRAPSCPPLLRHCKHGRNHIILIYLRPSALLNLDKALYIGGDSHPSKEEEGIIFESYFS